MLNGVDVLVFLLSLTYVLCADFSEKDAIVYLNRYEHNIDNKTDLSTSLITFQERYNLPVDGLLNNETIKFMRRPRCQHSDNDFIARTAWKKHHLQWYFPQRTVDAQKDAEMAFQMWQNVSNLTFTMVTTPGVDPPDITITMVSKTHYFRRNCMGGDECPTKVGGAVLGHSYFPNADGTCIEIHLDIDQSWHFGTDSIPEGRTSFLMVLVHEIGHALGIAHSATPNAIMYSVYADKIRVLHDDDINAVQYLYGAKSKYAPIPKFTNMHIPTNISTTTILPPSSRQSIHPHHTTPHLTSTTTTRPAPPRQSIHPHHTTLHTPSSTTTRPTTRKQLIFKNLCDIIPDFMFLATAPEFSNYRLYIAHNKFIWKLDLNGMIIPSQPELLIDYVPTELRQYTLQHIFQTTSGDLVTIVSPNKYFSASFPSIQYIDNFSLNIPNKARINAIFQSNAGRSYTFYNNMSYIEFSNDFMTESGRGKIKDLFPGIPEDISLAFRWTDGHIYFFRQSNYYKFNEFTRKVVAGGQFSWNLFGVPCPNENILYQLKTLLSKLTSIYS
ncbi:matrix metalloproteinase-16-like [Diabrotica virgifera virgifera]|uniref:Peptidase metallopeptidase domain-containing protein n=1 Tax=Diabrotica virgifera virgifera TaxID=50390 RepID=A0ABM5KZX9_DIAVI|nr:matrix metalloproteinase-16-like [Diabrotica virgifera virgifera]XP_050515746.1 matrix metalloproteinase-16-like [Diabrotica virgifera virgifera]